MRPLALHMQYFGPFMNEKIDFTQLSKSQLFLICGKTGSGKTMIFDAIVYALFGRTSTESREEVDLRSHFADPNEPTKVEFEFEIKGHQYLVTRTVKYIKAGNKNATNPTVEVYKMKDDEWELETKTINTSNDYLKSLLHMNVKQFRQILILPQGEFKQFLVSNSTDKRSILRTLFDSDRFETLQLRLEEEMKKELSVIEGYYQTITQYMSELHDFDEDSLIEVKHIEGHRYEKILDALPQFNEVGNHSVVQVQKQKDEQERALSEAESKLAQEKQLKDDFETLDKKKKAFETLKSDKQTIDKDRETLKYLKTVKSMTYQYDQLKEKEKHLQQSLKNETDLREQIEKVEIAYNQVMSLQKAMEENASQIDRDRKYVQQTNHIQLNADKYKGIEEQLPNEKKQEQQLLNSLDSMHSLLKDIRNERDTMQIDEAEAQKQIKQHEELRIHLQDLKNKQVQYNEKCKLQQRLEETEKLIHESTKQKKELEEKVIPNETYDILNVEDEIFKIKQHIHHGDDCPVCGSPIKQLDDVIDFDTLKKEKAYKESIETKIQQVTNQLTSYLERRNMTNEQLEKYATIVDVEADIKNTEKQIEQLASDIQIYHQRKDKLNQLKERIYENEKQLSQQELELNNIKHQIVNDESDFAYFKKETGYESVSEFITQYNENQAKVEQFDKESEGLKSNASELNDSRTELQMKQATIQERKTMLEEQITVTQSYLDSEMKEHDIASYEQLDTLLAQVKDIDEIELRIHQFDKKYIEHEAIVNELSKKMQNQTLPDVQNSEEAVTHIKQIYNTLVKELNQLQLKIEQNENKIQMIHEITNKIEQDLKDQQQMIALSRVMNGKNSQKISLENYVLIYYLNHILDNANYHFLKMTSNRYQLVRRKEKSQGLSGLEIEVFDRFSNRTRHITSLSGGETFQASLSLAIGLSNVVQQEAGAIHLESMFIDEGFGTLDSETLETALDTLVNIQMSGRLVGIISHVSELKTRIPKILNVKKNGFLSTTDFTDD